MLTEFSEIYFKIVYIPGKLKYVNFMNSVNIRLEIWQIDIDSWRINQKFAELIKIDSFYWTR
jgi:hypothetical protein